MKGSAKSYQNTGPVEVVWKRMLIPLFPPAVGMVA